jgi:D-alanyl-D-alanine carboxypeptidase
MVHHKPFLILFITIAFSCGLAATDYANNSGQSPPIPDEIQHIMNSPLYAGAIWGLRVVDLDTGELIYDMNPNTLFLIASTRKNFTIGEALNDLGADFRFKTPVHRLGEVDENGVLNGDLILVASGDLTMGGRIAPDGSMSIPDLDHNEANALGNARLPNADPLAGYDYMARKVAESGIREVNGDVIIDDRLFEPFNFRGEFDVRPIFVNDDVIDVIMNPTQPGKLASVDWRPKSSAFKVKSTLMTVAEGEEESITLFSFVPSCIGFRHCFGAVKGQFPVDFLPPPPENFLPLIRTFRIGEPSIYARTIFIEALRRVGIKVHTNLIGPNPSEKLPPENSYTPDTRVAELVSLPFSEYAKLIQKVSYNIGADTSLVLWGLTKGVNNMKDALMVEREHLINVFGIPSDEFHFVDGSGGGESAATIKAVIKFLSDMIKTKIFDVYKASLPILGVDGSLAFVNEFQKNTDLEGAKGNVFAKTGTYIKVDDDGSVVIGAQAFAGYIDAKSGRRLVYALYVNNVQTENPENPIDDVVQIFQDEGTISAIIWKEN